MVIGVHRAGRHGMAGEMDVRQPAQVASRGTGASGRWPNQRPCRAPTAVLENGKGAREAVRNLFDRLASFDPVQDGAAQADEYVKLAHFHFDDAAQGVFIEWSTEFHRDLISKEANPLMQQHLGQGRETVLRRIAGPAPRFERLRAAGHKVFRESDSFV